MERLVRNLDDLALMLSLLPRSATGQKLSVYTQLIHNPLEDQQRHFILLDNGRTRLRNSPLKDRSIASDAARVSMPVPSSASSAAMPITSVYPGPIGSVISAGLFGSEFVPLAQASSLCGACKDVCPVDIDLPKLLTRVRAGQAPRYSNKLSANSGGDFLDHPNSFCRYISRVATHPRLFAVSQKFASLGTYLSSPRSAVMSASLRSQAGATVRTCRDLRGRHSGTVGQRFNKEKLS